MGLAELDKTKNHSVCVDLTELDKTENYCVCKGLTRLIAFVVRQN